MANVVEPSHGPYAGATSLGGAMSQPQFPTTDHQEAVAKSVLARLSAATGPRAGRPDTSWSATPAERLAELADDEGAELIVVGSRGRGAFEATFLGQRLDQPGESRLPGSRCAALDSHKAGQRYKYRSPIAC